MTDTEPDEVHDHERAGAPLRVLARRTPVTSGWRAPDTVRRTAVRRRRAKWTGGVAVVLAAAVGIALSLGGSAGHRHAAVPLRGHVHTVKGPHGAVQLVADTKPSAVDASALAPVSMAEQRLGLALLNKVADGSNVSVSPVSLYLALGMLQNGARGQTATEISHALQASGVTTDDQNAGLAALTNELSAAAATAGIQFDSANSLWQQQGFQLRPAFLDALAAYYRSGVWQVDFEHDMDGALKALDAWTSDHTHGKITKLFDQLDPTTVLVLANAVYFHAAWATPFDGLATNDQPFTRADGTRVTAKFMHARLGLRALATSDYQAVELPYRGDRFTALAVMPTSGSLGRFVAGLSPDKLDSIALSLRSDQSVAMPRFTTTSKIDLKPVLQALGMRRAFGDAAQFPNLSPTPTKVDQVIQRDYLQVGEHGTTAAAVTGVSMIPLSAQPFSGPEVNLNHPFLFLIRDTQTGAILFASEITDPTAG